jgi:hypothetical protein
MGRVRRVAIIFFQYMEITCMPAFVRRPGARATCAGESCRPLMASSIHAQDPHTDSLTPVCR